MHDRPKYHVVVSSRARDMLFEHAKFLAQVSIDAAEALFDQFENNTVSLEDMPERCACYANPYIRSGKYRKLALGKHLLILFQIMDHTVFIELIIDARTDNRILP